jgi:hypothetical protein
MRRSSPLRRLHRNSLLWRFLLIGIAALAPLSAALVQFAGDERKMAMNATRERAEILGSYVIDSQKHVIEEARAALEFLSDSKEVRAAGPECGEFLRRYISMYQWMNSLRLSNPDGSETCNAHGITNTPNIRNREFFARAMQGSILS